MQADKDRNLRLDRTRNRLAIVSLRRIVRLDPASAFKS